MALTLSVTDNGNGTGATVTVSTTNVGTTWTIKRQILAANGTSGPITPVLTGDDIVSQTVSGVGFYRWMITDAIDGDQEWIICHPTDEGDSTQWRAGIMIRDKIASLSLVGNPTIYLHEMPAHQVTEFPCIIIHSVGQTPQEIQATNMSSYIEYPHEVVIEDSVPTMSAEKTQRFLYWLKAIDDAMRHGRWDQRFPDIYEVRTRPGPVFDPQAAKTPNYRRGGLTVLARARILNRAA